MINSILPSHWDEVLCNVYFIHCRVYCMQFTLHAVFFILYCVLHNLYCVLCNLWYVLCILYCVLYILYHTNYVFCSVHYLFFSVYTLYSVMCSQNFQLSTSDEYCVLWNVHCVWYNEFFAQFLRDGKSHLWGQMSVGQSVGRSV